MNLNNFFLLSVKNLIVISFFQYPNLFGQSSIADADYNTVLRMKHAIEEKIALYLDEPISGDYDKILQECNLYLTLAESRVSRKIIKIRIIKIKEAVKKMNDNQYNPNIASKEKSNIRYHYISLESSSKD